MPAHSPSVGDGASAATPIDLDPRYLAAVERWEARPENRSGADKTWVEDALAAYRRHYARAERVR
jgi:hypothetical protein